MGVDLKNLSHLAKNDMGEPFLSHTQASNPSSSSLDFSLAMAQISTPKTALAKTSEQEYPICSPAVAATPEIPSVRREGSDGRCLLLGSCIQAHSQLCHNIEKWNHGKEPPHPAAARTVLDLAWVAQSHHGC